MQETFLRAWRGLQGFGGHASVRYWLYRIATKACLNALATRAGVGRVLPETHVPSTDQMQDRDQHTKSPGSSPIPTPRLKASRTGRRVRMRDTRRARPARPSKNGSPYRRRASRRPPMRNAGYLSAMSGRGRTTDVDGITALLRDDTVLIMPPWRQWYQGRYAIGTFFANTGRACGHAPFWRQRPLTESALLRSIAAGKALTGDSTQSNCWCCRATQSAG